MRDTQISTTNKLLVIVTAESLMNPDITIRRFCKRRLFKDHTIYLRSSNSILIRIIGKVDNLQQS